MEGKEKYSPAMEALFEILFNIEKDENSQFLYPFLTTDF